MLIQYLKTELETRTRRNRNYSLRAFASSLKINSSTLSALLREKRPITTRTAKKILDELELEPETRNQLLVSTLAVNQKNTDNYVELGQEVIDIWGGWEHYAILSVIELSNFSGTTAKIAQRLNLGIGVVMRALDRLENAGLARREGQRWVKTKKLVTTTTGVPNSALRKAHREYIEKALYSMEHHPVPSRDITGMTMAISSKKLPEAIDRVKEFRRSLCRFLETGERDKVYRINIQLFPLEG